MTIGSSGGQTMNNGRMFIALKPRDQRSASAFDIIRRLQKPLAKVEGAALFLQAAQDLNVGGRVARTQFQYTLQDGDITELNTWAPKLLAKLKTLPQLADVATDQQSGGATLTLTIDRDQAERFGIDPTDIDATLYDAFGQRQVTQYFTQLNSYHVILELLPELQNSPRALEQLYIHSPLTGEQVPLSVLAKWTSEPTGFLSINHQGQFPAVTLSFNLAPGVALGDAVAAVHRAEQEIGTPATLTGSFQGNAQAFQASLASEPALVLAALLVIYVILGVLYESYVHPLTILSTLPSAGLGALAVLWAFGFDFSIIALIGIILLDRHREEERHHDRRLRHRARARRGHVGARRDPRGLPAALPPDPDDDDGGAARRRAVDARDRHRLGTASAARLCYRRRVDREPVAYPVHDARHLSLSRSPGPPPAGQARARGRAGRLTPLFSRGVRRIGNAACDRRRNLSHATSSVARARRIVRCAAR